MGEDEAIKEVGKMSTQRRDRDASTSGRRRCEIDDARFTVDPDAEDSRPWRRAGGKPQAQAMNRREGGGREVNTGDSGSGDSLS